jgi:hypothetical protein
VVRHAHAKASLVFTDAVKGGTYIRGCSKFFFTIMDFYFIPLLCNYGMVY